jgi:hypothetical protein
MVIIRFSILSNLVTLSEKNEEFLKLQASRSKPQASSLKLQALSYGMAVSLTTDYSLLILIQLA